MRIPERRTVLFFAVLALALLLAGCSKTVLEYIPSGGTYTLADVQKTASEVPLDEVDHIATADAPAARAEQMLELRAKGSDASALADALTRDFPSDTAAVPVRIEAATVDGSEVWIIIEAWGDKDGTLSHRRLWLLDQDTLQVTGSSSFR